MPISKMKILSISDVIEAPAHYVSERRYQPIAVIEDWKLCHHKACALKYIARSGRKDNEVQDLQKAVWYLQRKIQLLQAQERKR